MHPMTLSQRTQFASRTLTGWGLRNATECRLAQPETVDELVSILAAARTEGATVGLRGAGCSYGDAALNDQYVLDTSRLTRILDWNPETGIVTVEPGVTIGQLWRATLPYGWWPAVVPGYSRVTAGGAAAVNAHGKNNWRIGAFADTVLSFELVLPSGERRVCSRTQHADLFFAALGGLGLLGCFSSLTLRTRRVFSSYVEEVQTPHGSLAALLDAVEEAADGGTAMDIVTWVDTSVSGRSLGRGLLKIGRDLRAGEDPDAARHLALAADVPTGSLAHMLPSGLMPLLGRAALSRPGVPAFNRMQWLRSQGARPRRPHWQTYAAANFTLDAIPNWRDAYRPGGLLQHQAFVPREAALQAFTGILQRCQRAGIVPTLAVLKKHRASDALLSYLVDGYSLALDFPVRRGEESRTLSLLSDLNDITADAGGRCYFAKDSTATAAQVGRMYPAERIAEFLALKRQVDPDGLLSTSLYRRALAPLAG